MKHYFIGAGFCLAVGLTGYPANAEYMAEARLLPGHEATVQAKALDDSLLSAEANEEVTEEMVDGQNVLSPFMRVYNLSLPPVGYVRFCENNPSECSELSQNDDRVELTEERWQELDNINRTVNKEVYPITDEELYGRVEYWTYPKGKGDCEDYVLLKRRKLMDMGWPSSALLITVVLDEEGAGHAILTARTSGGDFILDNKRDELLAWYETPYRFLKRQSDTNPQMWLSLYPIDSNNPVAAFSAEGH